MKHVLIEGWRGINQSFSMVNQYQLIELCKLDGFKLFHRDLPFHQPTWNVTDHNPHFPPHMHKAINAIPAPDQEEFDCVYSILSPFRKSTTRASKVLTFMTGEFSLRPDSFIDEDVALEFYSRGNNRLVVPSRWSKMKLIEFGFTAEHISIIPHGVSPEVFSPLMPDERAQTRKNLGITPEQFIFLNLGAMTWNKGLDILLQAFDQVRRRHPQARLFLKDDQKLYGISAAHVIQKMLHNESKPIDADLCQAISIISNTLSLGQMRQLYGLADCYVSPYRAEGFNLPVIEAIACGTPTLVSAGGATDDFCTPFTSRTIRCAHVENQERNIPGPGYHLEPELDHLIEQMETSILKPMETDTLKIGREQLLNSHNWTACTRQLAALF